MQIIIITEVSLVSDVWLSQLWYWVPYMQSVLLYKVTVTGKIAGWLLAWAGSGYRCRVTLTATLWYLDISLKLSTSSSITSNISITRTKYNVSQDWLLSLGWWRWPDQTRPVLSWAVLESRRWRLFGERERGVTPVTSPPAHTERTELAGRSALPPSLSCGPTRTRPLSHCQHNTI